MREAHVLEIIGKRPVGGVGTVMLNYQRHMNMERVQMDLLSDLRRAGRDI